MRSTIGIRAESTTCSVPHTRHPRACRVATCSEAAPLFTPQNTAKSSIVGDMIRFTPSRVSSHCARGTTASVPDFPIFSSTHQTNPATEGATICALAPSALPRAVAPSSGARSVQHPYWGMTSEKQQYSCVHGRRWLPGQRKVGSCLTLLALPNPHKHRLCGIRVGNTLRLQPRCRIQRAPQECT